jgi:hypothetical protein
LAVAAKVSVIALAALAFITDRVLFYPSFALGFAFGAYRQWNSNDSLDPVFRKENIAFSGLIENITGVHLPDLICLGINVSSYMIHIDHHPELFVPATGLAVGAWAGHNAARGMAALF